MVDVKKDLVSRPDHYRCVDCQERFNDAKFEKTHANGIFSAAATCPKCGSSNIKISWWKRKEDR